MAQPRTALPRSRVGPRVGLWALVAVIAAPAGCAHRRSERTLAAAIAAQQSGDLDAARDGYLKTLELDDRASGAANNLALIALASGDDARAIDLLARELAAHPDLPAARLNRALLLVRAGRYADAEPDLVALTAGAAAAPSAPARHERAVARALLCASRARRGLPWEQVRDASGVTSNDAPADEPERVTRRVVGLAAFTAGRYDDALAWLAGDSDADGVRGSVAALVGLKRYGEAREALSALPSASAYDAVVAGWLAFRAEGDVAGALAAAPDDAWPKGGPIALARQRLVAADAARRGDWSGAAEALRAALDAGGAPEVRFDLVVALAHAGDLDGARDEATRVLRDAPDLPLARDLARLLE